MDTPWTGLTPRKYQEEIFTQSLESNVIAALGTGGGKTLISALLIKSMALKNVSRSKVIIFLVPKVALVEQQAAFLSSNTPLKVAKLHGQIVDVTDHSSWESRFKEHDVFVMTAQIFLNLLTHSIWSIERTSLIVFDECHSARKKHPYNQIMNGFYFHAPVALRPKIFGMTASPVWDPGDPMSCLTTLERNLDAKVVDVRQHSAELELHLPRPSEIIEVYAPPATEEHDSHLHRALGAFASFFSKNDDDFDWAKTERRYNAALYDLGVYCAELYLFREVDSRVSVLVAQAMPLLPDASGVDEEIITVPGFASRFKAPSPELAHVADILDDHRDFFLEDTSQHIALDRCTPKVGKLISILMDYEASTRTLRAPSSGSAMPNLAPFQTIIFVEQRHTASCLAYLLPRIAELGGKFESGVLLGEGAGPEGAPPTANAISGGGRADTLSMFRKGEINVLVATSVAEEGLDFPACSLVIRFDPLQNLVAYVQSRGRARNKTASKFIIMLREDDNVELERYRQFLRGEPELQKQLSARLSHPAQADEEDDESDALYEMNLKDRERYVVPGTGATLNYDNAISLLGQLCALIPCDAFTQKQAPKFDVSVSPFPSHAVASVISSELPCVGYSCMLRLPGSLPLPSTHLSYTGPVKLTKKEAKRAVAFQAVKALQEFNVFNEFLLPTTVGSKSKALKGKKDVDGRGYVDVSMVLPMMNVNVRDPWFSGPNTQNLGLASGATDSSLWLHAIYINDQRVAGVVADISLPPCEFWTDQGSRVKMMSGRKLNLRQFSSHDIADILMGCMAQYTLKGIWYFLTGSPAAGCPSFYIVPLVHDAIEPDIDFTALRSFAAHPDGQNDWSDVTPDHYDRVLVMNRNQYGRVYLLRRIRHDLSPQSRPVDGSRESGPSTYYEFWKDSWTRKKWIADVPEDGPLIEVTRLTRRLHAQYDVYRRAEYPPRHEVRDGALLPQGACVWIEFPPDVAQAFEIAPALAHRISDVYRVTSARLDIGLPAISPDLLVEAFTIPSANAPYNNQRLETLGDSVLKVCVTVHAFTKYPHRHEGQLTRLRQWTISNACLLARAKEVGLEGYLICENVSATRWPHFQWEGEGDDLPFKRFSKVLPRRSLQDCMEATLGAAFLTGGIPMVLHTGDALGLAFGGSIPWSLRYGTNPSPQSKLNLCYFESLQNSLGYSFRRPDLLVEALTHPSYSNESGGRSYQRLEFLGDAILDLVVVHFLYRKFPQATSHQLSFPRTRAICSQALAWVGIRKLQIHKFMLVNNFGLTSTVLENVSIFEECSSEEIVKRGWRYDPPKVISDIVESLLGGILVDSGWNYETISVVTEVLMADVLEVLSPALELYPTSDLTEWVATSGCEKLSWRKLETPNVSRVAVLIHDRVVAGPITSPSLALAKHAAAERALAFLRDPNSDKSLEKLCSCKTKRRHTPRVPSASCADQDDPEEEAERKEVETLLLSGI